jgi:hypothetical protein
MALASLLDPPIKIGSFKMIDGFLHFELYFANKIYSNMRFTSLLFAFIFIVSLQKGKSQSLYALSFDTCFHLQNDANFKTIKGTNHSIPLKLANGIIIRIEELNTKLLDSIYVLKCPQSFEKYGNLGTLGVIYLKTKQKFKTIDVLKIMKSNTRHTNKSNNIIYALNGFVFTDTTLLFSKKAITKVDIIENPSILNFETTKNTTCISIWTITDEELKKDASIPKLCRGVYINSDNKD